LFSLLKHFDQGHWNSRNFIICPDLHIIFKACSCCSMHQLLSMQRLKPKWFVLRFPFGCCCCLTKKTFQEKKTYFQQVGMKVSKPVLLPVYNVFFFFALMIFAWYPKISNLNNIPRSNWLPIYLKILRPEPNKFVIKMWYTPNTNLDIIKAHINAPYSSNDGKSAMGCASWLGSCTPWRCFPNTRFLWVLCRIWISSVEQVNVLYFQNELHTVSQ